MTPWEGIGCDHIGDIVKLPNLVEIFYSTPGHGTI